MNRHGLSVLRDQLSRALVRMQQSQNHAQHGRLSLSARSNQRHNFSRRGNKVGIGQDAMLLDISKIHMLQLHGKSVLCGLPHSFRLFRHMYFARQLHQLPNAPRRHGAV